MAEKKTFKVHCAECGRGFIVRFPLANPKQEGSGEVHVHCLHCEEDVMVRIPRKYIRKDHLIRGIKSLPTGGSAP